MPNGANGFFEWRNDGKQKFPIHFKLKMGASFTFQGLWDAWKQPDGTALKTYTLMTDQAMALANETFKTRVYSEAVINIGSLAIA